MTMKSADLILNAAENNPVYSLFEKPEVLTFLDGLKIEKTIWKDDIKSERSLRLATKSPKKPDDLIHSFNLDPKSFPEQFKNAIGGGGQEYRKIRTLHSSSLISLLCFYAVSKERPLHLNLEGRQVSFTSSKFEVPNFVGTDETGKEHNSNMDVVLCGKDVRTGKKVILFLEIGKESHQDKYRSFYRLRYQQYFSPQ